MTATLRHVLRSIGQGLVLLTTAACTPTCPPERWAETHATGSRLSRERPECPQVWDSIPVWDTLAGRVSVFIPTGGRLAVPGPITDVPEFHDCQRFIEGDGPRFGALFAVFASRALDSLTGALGLDSATWSSSNTAVATVSADGVVTAVAAGTASIQAVPAGNVSSALTTIVTVAPDIGTGSVRSIMRSTAAPDIGTGAGGSLMLSAESTSAVLQPGQSVTLALARAQPTSATIAAAQVYTYGPGYRPLGVGPDFSCLYVFVDGGGTLAARMVPVGAVGEPCSGRLDPREIGGTALSVLRTKPGVSDADYPPVARWDYDTTTGQYYIGIKCGRAWCEVGAPGFTPSATRAYDPTGTPEENRVLRVKGWYDQQVLAVDAAASAEVVPSGIKATVVPHPALGRMQEAEWRQGKWITTGYVGLDTTNARSGAVAAYKRKFNYDPVAVKLPLESMNTIAFCFGTRSTCEIPDAPSGQGCNDLWWGFWPRRVWWVKTTSPLDKQVMYRCIVRRGHENMPDADLIAPTARWRWVASDETTWKYCASHYCCEVGTDAVSEGWQ